MIKTRTFVAPEGFDLQQMIGQPVDDYVFKEEATVTESLSFYDTFDWRLYNQSLVLYRIGEQLCLRQLFDHESIYQLAIQDQPLFAWDLPESELRTRLAPVIEMRALFSLAESWRQSTTYRVVDPAEKTVAWLNSETLWSSPAQDGRAVATHIRLTPVRGYPKTAKRIGRHLKQLGMARIKQEDIYFKALEIAGKTADIYSSKLRFELNPDMRADEAAKIILSFLLDVIKANEPYVKQDIDTEFLHDFRVAVRRTRSLLSQVKGIFPEDTTRRFRQEFAGMGQLTNRLRDLDVYLLAESSYRDMLPPEMHADLTPLFDYLRAQRGQALQEVIDGFESDALTGTLTDWENFLSAPVPSRPEPASASQPILNLARQRIYKRYKRVIKDGTYILSHAQDQLLHDLRIEVKKLRYLMEFFASLFPEQPMNQLIGQLKRLHNNLGDFNDLFVQQHYLAHIVEELPVRDLQSKKAVVATGYLIKTLADEQALVKSHFAEIFTDFASPANRKLFRHLFAVPKARADSS